MPDIINYAISRISASLPDLDGVATDLVGYSQGMSWVRLNESPGVEIIKGRLDSASVDVNVYAEDLQSTRELAFVVRAILQGMIGTHDATLVVTNVVTGVTPYELTDLVNARPRYVFTMNIYYRPK
jgi:hypothetical protein